MRRSRQLARSLMLARDFIQDSMYHRSQGYFATGDCVREL